jgi:hypothetical protein
LVHKKQTHEEKRVCVCESERERAYPLVEQAYYSQQCPSL